MSALGDLPDDRLFVHRIVERLAHAPIVKGSDLRVKPDVEEAERRYTDSLILPVPRIGADLVYLLAGDNRLFQVPLQELSKHLLETTLILNTTASRNGRPS